MERIQKVLGFEDVPFGEFEIGSEVPEMPVFRAYVEKIPKKRDRLIIQTLYLTACRISELTTHVSPSEFRHDGSKPYGIFHNWKIGEYMGEKVLLLRFAVAKRVKREKREALLKFLGEFQAGMLNVKLANELKNAIAWKYIALPCNPIYEPWTLDLLRYIKEYGSLTFNVTRQTVWRIIRRSLKELDAKVHPHSLRHYRINHLIEFYGFDAWDLSAYAGWSLKTTLGKLGMPTGQLDIYSHLSWRRYFPKLLKPLM